MRHQPWSLLFQAGFAQGTTFLIRPTSAYRALELGIDFAWLGFLAAAFSLLPSLIATFVGHFVDRGNEHRTLVFGASLTVLSAGGLVFWSSSLMLLLAWNSLLGLGFICCVVSQQTLVAQGDPKTLDSNFGVLTFVGALGQSLGPLAITVFSGHSAFPDTTLLFVVGVCCAVVALVLAIAMRSPGRVDRSIGHVSSRPSIWEALRAPSRARGRLLIALVVSIAILAAVDLLTVYLPAWGVEVGISATMVGVLLSVRSIATMLSRLGLGAMVRVFGRSTLIIASTLIAGIAVLLLGFTTNVLVAGMVLVVAGVALGIGQPLTMATVSLLAPPGTVGLWLSIRLTGNSLGLVLIPPAVGLVSGALGVVGVFGILAVTLAGVAGLAWAGRR
ncbi:MFS transporter [Microbacterium faecale]|uniref:MFS transporter n=1 Tax=Microbacterium faecale TaxID=1804630 RepID=A0A916Y6S6_9MICO|nr:MFS transporter [Microbacterium faecale]GGD31652.1 MFS transporter [Microbacterium faecale]